MTRFTGLGQAAAGLAMCWTLVYPKTALAAPALFVRPITPAGMIDPSAPPPQAYASGKAALTKGEARQALAHFRAALRIDPAYVPALSGAAVALEQLGRGDLARPYFEAAVALQPDKPDLLFNLGLSLSHAGMDQLARPLLNKAAALDKGETRHRSLQVLAQLDRPNAGALLAAAPAMQPVPQSPAMQPTAAVPNQFTPVAIAHVATPSASDKVAAPLPDAKPASAISADPSETAARAVTAAPSTIALASAAAELAPAPVAALPVPAAAPAKELVLPTQVVTLPLISGADGIVTLASAAQSPHVYRNAANEWHLVMAQPPAPLTPTRQVHWRRSGAAFPRPLPAKKSVAMTLCAEKPQFVAEIAEPVAPLSHDAAPLAPAMQLAAKSLAHGPAAALTQTKPNPHFSQLEAGLLAVLPGLVPASRRLADLPNGLVPLLPVAPGRRRRRRAVTAAA